ncbi:hydroxypyruvate isomerase family protein [Mucilaginibacter myungsuensis]|uniref:TIM barrel protein n=1 Tax=Mucilaginibacter myungsuensis TaxID=649104 RepID=A0A929PXX3_9SPHI|nr:TIM barrel protein [Mucilaginibacter myungsuensis]MBE9662855.1 TIM barrel protein [Mucilaginibacter myungsuensis]MDN3598275.1 TIM barrel protein [Mucilaginibacter myungsuensis]
MERKQNRRSAIKNIITGTVAAGAAGALSSFTTAGQPSQSSMALKGNINHSVARWCFNDFTLDELCGAAKDMGMTGIDLIGPGEWHILKKHGLTSAMCNGAEINLDDGFGEKKFHAQLHKNYTEMIPKVADAGYKNLICFSGRRRGMDNETVWSNCVEGLKPMVELAARHNVTLVMELLNSKINHKDYFADRTANGVEICKRLGSENFKLLYDIYHMQVDEGDVIHNIRENHQYIAHYHTAGVPGRNEIDDTQELYYPAIMKAIVATGFKGFVAQEFLPKQKDKLASLKKSVQICDV